MQQKTFEVKVYTLTGKDDKVFYVGCTINDVEKRLYQHIVEAKKFVGWNKMPLKNYAIIMNDFEVFATVVEIIKIDAVDGKEAKFKAEEFEKKWIIEFQNAGVDLCNSRNTVRKDKPQFVGKVVKAA